MTDTEKLRWLAEDVNSVANWKCEPRGSTWKHGPLNYCRKPFDLAEQATVLCDEVDRLREALKKIVAMDNPLGHFPKEMADIAHAALKEPAHD